MKIRRSVLGLLFILLAAALTGCTGGPNTRELRTGLVASGNLHMNSEGTTLKINAARQCQPPYPQELTFRHAGDPVDPSAATEIWYVEYTTCEAGDCVDTHTTIGKFPPELGFKYYAWLAEDYPTKSMSAPACE